MGNPRGISPKLSLIGKAIKRRNIEDSVKKPCDFFVGGQIQGVFGRLVEIRKGFDVVQVVEFRQPDRASHRVFVPTDVAAEGGEVELCSFDFMLIFALFYGVLLELLDRERTQMEVAAVFTLEDLKGKMNERRALS